MFLKFKPQKGLKEYQINSNRFLSKMNEKEFNNWIWSGDYTAAIYAARAGLEPLLISGLNRVDS